MPSSDQLRDYRRKRRLEETPEPSARAQPRARAPKKRPVFVIQRHQARALHYDLRLERDGALASWAVPKGIPLEPGQQHLAVHVEDHPLSYASFEGEIPAGNYGADRKSTRLNSSHGYISYAVFCLIKITVIWLLVSV